MSFWQKSKALHACKARAILEVVKRKKQRLISLKTRKLLIIASVSKDNTLMRRRGSITTTSGRMRRVRGGIRRLTRLGWMGGGIGLGMWMEILYRMLIQMDLRLNMRSLRIQIRNPLQSIVFQTMLERETWLIQMRKNTRAQAKDSVATEEPVEHAV